MRYDGRFIGIESVEVTGEYKGLTAFGVSEMLRTLIKELIEKLAALVPYPKIWCLRKRA